MQARVTTFAVMLLAVLTLGAAVASGSSRSESTQLYAKLLATKYAKSELPSGYSSAVIGKQAKSSNDIKYHAIGVVSVEYKGGPDVADVVLYYIFPNAADASADLTHPDLSASNAHVVGTVPGAGGPSLLLAGSITGKNSAGKTVTNGVTGAAFSQGFVVISAATVSDTSTTHGDETQAVALLRSATSHLAAVGQKR